ncbi:hypothetical protein HERIO_3 [Hepatospora eriocheir]|uniref:Uncharacterized protein n=1 Tax=Hepatospora eriocheir TaxID=1081669 RepID=A0A1X0QE72_9MICR|nr:hypothetical protein HERIO_3 [Hepatospora eriocheir]
MIEKYTIKDKIEIFKTVYIRDKNVQNTKFDKFVYFNNYYIFCEGNKLFNNNKTIKFNTDITCIVKVDNLLFVGLSSGDITIYNENMKCISKYFNIKSKITGFAKVSSTEIKKIDDSKNLVGLMNNKDYYLVSSENNCLYVLDLSETNITICIKTSNGIRKVKKANNILYLICKEKIFKYGTNFLDTHDVIATDANTFNDFILSYEKNSFTLTNGDVSLSKVAHHKRITTIESFNNVIYTISTDGCIKSWTVKDSQIILLNLIYLKESFLNIYIEDHRIVLGSADGKVYEKRITNQITENDLKRVNFNYKEIFSANIDNVDNLYFLLRYLKDNKKLKRLLKDMDVDSLTEFVHFCVDYFYYKELRSIIIECVVIIISMYEIELLHNEELLSLLEEKVLEEIYFEEACLLSLGFIN